MSTKTVIRVEGVSKKFILDHENSERYTTFRESISRKLNRFSKVFNSTNSVSAHTKEEFWALKDLNFTIQQGDRVGIIGRNGAGKSTLLKILSRITPPTSGKISITGRVASLLEVGTGFHPELTGRENIYLNGAILGMSRAEIRKKFDEIVDFAEVEKFLDTPVKRYSSGMYVRLAFSVAAHLEPEILIVDEVLAVGDAQFQKKCLGKMQEVSTNDGRTILFVSHNMGILNQLCQNAILLKNGEIIKISDTRSTIEEYMQTNKEILNKYVCNENKYQKELYFKSVESLNKELKSNSEYRFDEEVLLKIIICAKKIDPSAKISITLQNNLGEFISTLVEDLILNPNINDEIEFIIKFSPKIIAPNSYAFRLAIFNPNITVYDIVEMVCPFKIIDIGTKMSQFEGINYGYFFLDYTILN